MKNTTIVSCLLFVVLLAVGVQAEEKISLSSGQIAMTAPKEWKKVKPKSRIVEFEFAAPAAKGDDQAGRVTVMGAGGSIDANIQRWMGQFTQPDNKPTKDRTKTTKKTQDGYELHVVDITGTFLDRPGGPFAPGRPVQRKDYRMLGAILVTPKQGQYFVKLYGPKKTVDSHEKAFVKMVESAVVK